ncbi:Lecithin:cholesterol acyltransferase family protein [Histomonas meleagridis]|uniref:Lecithin:cholesterol acyltransferase family protein n=1 Tax=Histomonas meleagridis TaxID=135588 RepID=UPI00355A9898|nr:Lecithin:cholesterol acyltransferase family protein [Histomonas meleagridis]
MLHYDKNTDTYLNSKNTTVQVVDFGGVSGIDYIHEYPFGIRGGPGFYRYIKLAQERGYVVGKDLFGAPYDWRYGIFLNDTFWQSFSELIENSVNINGEKASIHAHSFGCVLTHYFLTHHVTEEWKSQYIQNVVLVGPAFSSSPMAMNFLSPQKIFGIRLTPLENLARSLPSLYHFMPNLEMFGDIDIVKTDSRTYKLSEIENFALDYNNYTEEQIITMKKGIKLSREAPKPINANTFIIYNSAMKTGLVMEYKNGKLKFDDAKGDAVVTSHGIDWICKNWKMEHQLKCVDLNQTKNAFHHKNLVANDVVINMALDWALGSSEKNAKTLNEDL